MKNVLTGIFAVIIVFVQMLQGAVPQKWELQNMDEFLKGKCYGISVSNEGVLTLSPGEEEIEGPSEEFYLSLLITSEGTVYLGTGHGGNIYKINPAGKAELYFKVPEMDVYCLALDTKGYLYAGTSPNGKIYKITSKGKGDVFFNPEEKYIWSLMFSKKGNLLASVGESGGIYEINSQGEGRSILRAEENHILCMKMDKNGNLFAGSGGRGLVYRISRKNNVSVLFESSYEEVKSIDIDSEGNIYAAAGGNVISPMKVKTVPILKTSETDLSMTVTPSSSTFGLIQPTASKQPGALYKINPDGLAKKLWHSDEDLIFTLVWDEKQNGVIFGTGPRGRIFMIDRNENVSLILQKNSEQVYSLNSFNSKIYNLSNNPSNLSIILPEQGFSGEYISRVFDTKTVSSWGKISWQADIPQETIIQFQTRSGNSNRPNQSWSEWSPPYRKFRGEQVLSPKARYIQFKVIFKTSSGKVFPRLQKVSLFYLQSNLAPVIDKIELFPPNDVFLKPPEQDEIILGTDLNLPDRVQDKYKAKIYLSPKKSYRKGFQTVKWDARDANDDSLVYSIWIKEEKENKWRLLKEKYSEKIFAFDTLSFPDGVYFLKIESSDSPSNPVGTQLKSYKTSRSFIIDNSLPVIRNSQAVRNKNQLTLTFSVEDSFSCIKKVQFLIRPGGWKTLFPVDGICDSNKENFNLTINLPAKFDNLVSIKAVDWQDNVGVARQIF